MGDAGGASAASGGASASSGIPHRRVSDIAGVPNHRSSTGSSERSSSNRHSGRSNGASATSTSSGATSSAAATNSQDASRFHGAAQRRHSTATTTAASATDPRADRHNSPAPRLSGGHVPSSASGSGASAQNSLPARQTQVSRSMRYRRDHHYPSITEGAAASGIPPASVGPSTTSKSLGGVRTDLERTTNPSPTSSAASSSASVKGQTTDPASFTGSAHNPNKSEIPGRRGASYARSFKLPKVKKIVIVKKLILLHSLLYAARWFLFPPWV